MRSLLAILAALALPAYACVCPPQTDLFDRFREADRVLVIRIDEAHATPHRIFGKATVLQALKGETQEVLEVNWHVPQSNCWAAVHLGAEYVVFLPEGRRAAFLSGCQRPIQMRDLPPEVLRAWEDAR
jgi:hypothetical protein